MGFSSAPHMVVVSSVLPILPVTLAMQGLFSLRKSCYFRPCAPQSIYEWDQAFAICVGLFILALEIGPDVMKPVKRIWLSIWTKDEELDVPLLDVEIV